jgi:hypothetical protein
MTSLFFFPSQQFLTQHASYSCDFLKCFLKERLWQIRSRQPGWSSRHSYSLQAGISEVRTSAGERFSAPVFIPAQSPPIFPYDGYWGFFVGVKRSGRGVDHSPSSSAEVKERVGLHLHPPACFPGMV